MADRPLPIALAFPGYAGHLNPALAIARALIAAGRSVEGNGNRPARAKCQVRLQSTIFDPDFAVATKTVSAHRDGLNHRAPTADPRAIRVYARATV